MRLFSTKRSNPEEEIAKPDSTGQDAPKLDEIEKRLAARRSEYDVLESKMNQVKQEYEASVSKLMAVKREINEGKNRIISLERQQRIIKAKTEETQSRFKTEESRMVDLKKAEARLSRVREDTETHVKRLAEVRTQIATSQQRLHELDSRCLEAEDRYRAVQQAGEDRAKPQGDPVEKSDKDEPKSVVEAASAVVAAVKTRLNMAQREIETLQGLLEKERRDHESTKRELQKLQSRAS